MAEEASELLKSIDALVDQAPKAPEPPKIITSGTEKKISVISVRLDEDLMKQIKDYETKTGQDRSKAVRTLIAKGLEGV